MEKTKRKKRITSKYRKETSQPKRKSKNIKITLQGKESNTDLN